MATPVIMPRLEMSQESATIIEWLVDEGQFVQQGQPLLTVETDKVTVEVEAPTSGVLASVSAIAGQEVAVTSVIAQILAPGEVASTDSAQPRLTPLARRISNANEIDPTQIIGSGPGKKIVRADIERYLAARSTESVDNLARGASEQRTAPRPRATPAARRLAHEKGVNLAEVSGSGPRGRIQSADVAGWSVSAGGARTIPLSGMRLTIAKRLLTSYQTVPHISFVVSANMAGYQELRACIPPKADGSKDHLSVTAFLVKAVAWTLARHPGFNSRLSGDAIQLLPDINVGVAVALPDGVIVPVVHGADKKDLAECAVEVDELAKRARDGRLSPADVADGTFTISNLGPYGIEQFSAIINPPQVAILAVGAIRREATVNDADQVVILPILRLTLSVDHRVIDGAAAAQFLSDLRTVVETPSLLAW